MKAEKAAKGGCSFVGHFLAQKDLIVVVFSTFLIVALCFVRLK